MKYVGLTAVLVFASGGWSQDVASDSDPLSRNPASAFPPVNELKNRNKASKATVPNPFNARPQGAGMSGMDMGMGMGGVGGMEMGAGGMTELPEMGFGGVGDDDMVDMGMGMEMMGGAAAPSPDQLFQRGLQRAIQSLKKAKSDDESATLHGYIRSAFEGRYETQIATRKKDLERLKKSIARLESDLRRREAAKDRVVQLQLQSVQLAAEGLLELGELQGVPSGGDTDDYQDRRR